MVDAGGNWISIETDDREWILVNLAWVAKIIPTTSRDRVRLVFVNAQRPVDSSVIVRAQMDDFRGVVRLTKGDG